MITHPFNSSKLLSGFTASSGSSEESREDEGAPADSRGKAALGRRATGPASWAYQGHDAKFVFGGHVQGPPDAWLFPHRSIVGPSFFILSSGSAKPKLIGLIIVYIYRKPAAYLQNKLPSGCVYLPWVCVCVSECEDMRVSLILNGRGGYRMRITISRAELCGRKTFQNLNSATP